MKILNYSLEYLCQPKTYAELFELKPQLYTEMTDEEAERQTMPFGKYCGMLFTDLIGYDFGYFSYMRKQILKEQVSTSLLTYNQRVRMLQAMAIVERNHQITKWGEEYARRNYTYSGRAASC